MWELRKIAKALSLFVGLVFVLEVIRRLYNRVPKYLRSVYLLVVSVILTQPFMLLTTIYQKHITDPELTSILSSVHFHVIIYLISMLFFAVLIHIFLGWYINKVNYLMSRAGRVSLLPRKVFGWMKRPFNRNKKSSDR